MKAIDLQVQTFTKEARKFFPNPDEIEEMARKVFKRESVFMEEEKLIEGLRKAEVKAIMMSPMGWARKTRDMGLIREMHNYMGHLREKYPDVILGCWGDIDPQLGYQGARELERCINEVGMLGIYTGAILTGIPVNDKLYWPLYQVCVEYRATVKLSVGMTAVGQGKPGGGGVLLEYENPIPYVDQVAALFPELRIIAAHCAWPFHNEMIAVMIHKANVFNELHGWSPRYFPPEINREINGRLQDRFMFGSDHPWFMYDRLFSDWEAGEYRPDVLKKVYYENALRVMELKV
ncbi:MAG: amidohydrolase family protein [Syntrophales bacterium]|nr:amidohydrolase family protein [Syntrophales bacterium]